MSPQLPAPWMGPLPSLARDYVIVWRRCHLGSLGSVRAEASLGHSVRPMAGRRSAIDYRGSVHLHACGHRAARTYGRIGVTGSWEAREGKETLALVPWCIPSFLCVD